MKEIIFTVISILFFYFSVFAQTDENSCSKIKINAPETVQAGSKFTVSASFENEKQPFESKFNWVIINEEEVSKISRTGIVDIQSKNLRDLVTIIIVAEDLENKCQTPAMTKVLSVPNFGSPYIIDEFQKLSWNDEKARLENAVSEIQKMKDMKLLVFLYLDKKESQTERKSYLVKLLNFISNTERLEKNRIIFSISESEEKTVRLQTVPIDSANFDNYCDNCLTIKGEDFAKLNKLFQSKQLLKTQK